MKTWIGWLAVGMAALSALAADRANDGRGLIEAFTSNNNYSGDIWPFRWYASAVSGGNSGNASNHAIDRTGANTWAPQPVYQLERWGGEGDFVLKCPVPPEASFAQARAALQAQLRQLPAGYRPVLTADAFACVPDETPPEEDGVEYLISCSYANPLLAYDAGVRCGEEVLRYAAF